MNPPERRQCGACTACCHVLEIDDPELTKPSGELCRHCSSGCTIYPQRPKVCRDWHCLWREFPGLLDESWRPDRSGVLMHMAEVEATDIRVPCFDVLEAVKVDWTGLAAVIAPYLRAGDDVYFGQAAQDGRSGKGLPLRMGLSPDADIPTIRAGLLDAWRTMTATG